jgi:predicted TIM-barrel fold metal-dependent hydrolase
VSVIQSREDLSMDAKAAILGGNALRLFGLSM